MAFVDEFFPDLLYQPKLVLSRPRIDFREDRLYIHL